jgi:DNA replication and repair protein RecF
MRGNLVEQQDRRLEGRGQVWMTATEASLFDGIDAASRFQVQPGKIALA